MSTKKLSVMVKPMGSEETLVIESSPYDRVMDVKMKIQEIEGTPVGLQTLIFHGRPLQNHFALYNYSIYNGSVLHFVARKKLTIKVFITTLLGKKIPVECEAVDKVRNVKRKIQELEGIRPDQIRLMYGGEQLEDERTLSHYGIQDHSIIHMVLRLCGGGIIVKIRISDGRSFDVKDFGTIRELKHKIYEKSGIPIHRQVLSFNGTVLKDECNSIDYNIQSGDTMDVNILREG